MKGIFLILLIGFTLPSFSASVATFRKEKSKLVEYKKRCEKKDEPDRSECLEKYEKKKAKYKQNLAKFKERAGLENQKREARRANSSPKSIAEDIKSRKQNIKNFQTFVDGSCVTKKNSRCALAYYQLADMTYKNEEDEFRITQTKYEKDMQKWEDHDQRGPEPVMPKRTHTKSKEYFQIVLEKYPKYQDIPVVYYRLAFIESIQGNDDLAFKYLDKLVKGYPNHGLVIPSQLRIGEHWYMLRQYKKAIAAYEKIPVSYGGQEAALAMYHKAECYYNMADFEKAAKIYYEFVVLADKGKIKSDLRNEAMEFMAASWADIDGGIKIAHRFLKGKGHKWEKDVYYTIGEKNLSHDRLEQARIAFRHLLDIDPNYPKAPQADIAIVKTLVIEKRADEAQKARIALVERYQGNSEWAAANSNNKKGKEEADKAVKAAMFQIPVYYHHKATKKDEKKPDLKLLAKAQNHYQNYLNRYKGNTWEVYETHQNLGAINHLLGNYKEAAAEYKWCANAPVDKYGKIPKEKKKSILTKADASYNVVYMLDLDRQKMVKSMGDKKVAAYNKPQTQEYFTAVENYMKDFGKSNTAPDIAYNAALVHYEAKQYNKAVTSLRDLRKNFKNHKHSNLIRRMLGQSLLESGSYKESEEVFAELLKKTNRSAKEYNDIELSVASAIFKQADKLNKEGEHKQAAEAYLRVVKKYGGVNIADKALFEAGTQFEEAGDVSSATETFISLHKRFPKSDLKIKAIIRAGSIYRKNERFKESAETFLIVRNQFPKDTNAFLSIGWAAEAYTNAKSLAMAAKTYESAHRHFPKHDKTPSYVYNSGQTYEELKDWSNAIRVYELLGSQYKKSSFAIEAMFSVPLIQEKRGNYSQAATAYKEFISKYNNDPQKLIRAQLAAGKIYADKLNKKDVALKYFDGVKETYNANKKQKIPAAIPAEAGYKAGEIYFNLVDSRKLNSSKKENAKRLKEIAADLQKAVAYFSFSLEHSEQEWTLRSTLMMGDLFMSMARITSEEKISAKRQEAIMGEKISMLRGLPGLYDNAKSIFQKNLDLSREQGIKNNEWITKTEERYMQTYQFKARVFIDIGIILSNSPLPSDLSPEEVEEYKAILQDKKYEMEQAAKGPLTTGLKAAQFYSIDNEVTSQIKSMLSDIDPEAPELSLKHLTQEEREIVFVDDTYKQNTAKIAEIYNSSDSDKSKIKAFKSIEKQAKAEIERLQKELDQSGSATGVSADKSP